MAGLKDQLERDLKDVFLRPDEFAQEHIFDGKPILCILEQTTSKTAQPLLDGVAAWSCVLHATVADIGKEPMIGSLHELDGRDMLVGQVGEANGMYAITLGVKW